MSLNPYATFPLYTMDKIHDYHARGNRTRSPHVYEVADRALRPLLEYREPQSILISGESGAGKTEACKDVLRYLSQVAGTVSEDLALGQQSVGQQVRCFGMARQILASNPILESFGNAKTVRNDNSSRFGKWINIALDQKGRIQGASIVNYLLEKSRVVRQGPGERNYHVFFMLLASGDAKAEPIARAIEGPLTAMVPASALQLHPHATAIVDEAAAASLTLADYFRQAWTDKPDWQGL